MYELIEGYLKHKSDMVNYEAARAICEMRNVGANELQRPIAVLQLFLSSPKPTLKFAAIRTLSKLAQTQPNAVQVCNLDMEKLINDDNRSVATFAITTLLKTGNEASVDRLMKQISAFMSEISDDFKVIVVNAIRALCLKFPAKQSVMLNFLSGILRDEGGYDFKRAVVEAIFDMIKFIGDSKEAGESYPCPGLAWGQHVDNLHRSQRSPSCASSSRTASSPSSPSESCTCSESKAPRPPSRTSTSGTSTIASSSKTRSSGPRPSLAWPSLASMSTIRPSSGVSRFCSLGTPYRSGTIRKAWC